LIPSGQVKNWNVDQFHIGVCTLASINLAKLFIPEQPTLRGSVNWQKLKECAYQICLNLNQVIDRQYYSLEECRNSSKGLRPIGIGIQGLSDLFMMLKIPYCSEDAKNIDQWIAEEIYHAALCASMDLVDKKGFHYDFWEDSPASLGKLQPHLWMDNGSAPIEYSKDWDAIAKEVTQRGLYNSLLLAYMPTASTSRIFGTYAGFDPIISNIVTRQTKSGNFTIINRYLVEDLTKLGLWDNTMKDRIILANGSVQDIDEIPDDLKQIYRTAWEMKMKHIMDMADRRGRFICQTQSMNLFFNNPNVSTITSALFYANNLGLKTMSYYTRSRAAIEPVKITISYELEQQMKAKNRNKLECINKEDCEACGS
jgi:ribonucleoside-diphosphate reductase alpha chain